MIYKRPDLCDLQTQQQLNAHVFVVDEAKSDSDNDNSPVFTYSSSSAFDKASPAKKGQYVQERAVHSLPHSDSLLCCVKMLLMRQSKGSNVPQLLTHARAAFENQVFVFCSS